MVDSDRNHMTVRSMRCARCITEATYTYSECVTLIAFPRKQWVTRKRLMIAFMLTLLLLFGTITMLDEVTAPSASSVPLSGVLRSCTIRHIIV